MNSEYVISVDSMVVVRADSEEEAIKTATQDFVEMLQKDNAEIVGLKMNGECGLRLSVKRLVKIKKDSGSHN